MTMTTEEKIAHMDTRLTLIEEKVSNIDAKVDTRFDEVMTVLGASPNAALGMPGSGLAGSVSALLAAEQERKRAEQERERKQADAEAKRRWVMAVLTLLVSLLGVLNVSSWLRR